MELVFLWVEKIRNLENLSLSFSNDFHFSYNSNEYTISETANSEININNFYGEAVTNLTAIVGQNGVGKSTLFLLLRNVSNDIKVAFLGKERRRGPSISRITYVALFKIGNSIYHFKNGIHNKIISKYPELNDAQKKHIDRFQCFYYANFFDYSQNHTFSHIIDVSTTALVNDAYNKIREKTYENEEYLYEEEFSLVYKANEILNQIQFVSDFDNHLPFELPRNFAISLILDDEANDDDNSEEDYKVSDKDDLKYYQALRVVDKIKMKFRGDLNNNNTENEFKKYVKTKVQQAAISGILQENVFYQTNVVGHYEVNFDITQEFTLHQISATKNLDKFFVEIIDMFSTGNENYSGSSLLKWIENLIDLIDVKKYFDTKENVFQINLAEVDERKVKQLVRSYSEMQFNPNFLNFYWSGISSGENALITIFSRFYEYRRLIEQEDSNLLLIFDECEVNFHPAWQRKLIHFITTIFPLIFPNSKFQIFVSSHSPLILSDIPKSNIVFLEKDNKGRINISHLTDKKQTFAANIHSLLSDAFFMDEGTIGEVAKTKINWLIDSLSMRYADFEELLPIIESLVELIGEPVIKSKLTSMINEKHSLNFYNLNKRVQTLENRRKR